MSTKKSAERPPPPPYHRADIAVGTRHGKQDQFAPAFRDILRARLITPAELDTDRFGTFTGERPRPGDALEAARAKARLAMQATGLPLGLASEASYGPLGGPLATGGWTGHEEILLFCDAERGIEVLEGHRGALVPGLRRRIGEHDEVPDELLAALPQQGLIVRPAGTGVDPDSIVKGITDADTLRAALAWAVALSPQRLAVVEPDLRAHHNPSRRQVLVRLAGTLARRLATRCPACAAPGFGRVATEPGLPCRTCATPTPLPRCEIHACAVCAHRTDRPVPTEWADATACPECNP